MNEITWLSVLSSMITPAVLILASGSLIMTTSQRLSRVIERVRKVSQEYLQIDKQSKEDGAENKRKILFRLLEKSAKRCRLLTKAMTYLYVSLGCFVATSLSIAVVSITHWRFTWIPTAIGLTGAVFLFVSSAILVVESRLTFRVIADEMDFVIESIRSSTPGAPAAIKKSTWKKWLKLP
jgi:hypothetical protein